MVARIVALIWFAGATSFVLAQEALNNGLPQTDESASSQSVAENAWIDLRQRPSATSRPQSAPSWVEAVSMTSTTGTDGRPRAVFRIRVSRPSADYQIMFFRIFFDDKADARPEIVAWDELGTQVLRSGDLGSGVGLPSSDSVMIPMNGISTLDIEVPGEGKTVRAAYLDWMTSSEVVHPVNAEHRDVIPEPFSSLPPLHSPEQDLEHFGTVTATLASEPIAIGADAQHAATFQFGIESQPLLALLTFEVASPQIDSPPEVYVRRRTRHAHTAGIGRSRLSRADGITSQRNAFSIHRLAARAEADSGHQLESWHERCDHPRRRRNIDIGDSRDAGAIEISLGKIGLSPTGRPLTPKASELIEPRPTG